VRGAGCLYARLIHATTTRRHQAFTEALQQFAWSTAMLDAVMLAIGFAFFALSIAYVYACDLL
jgi:hypothetical protein